MKSQAPARLLAFAALIFVAAREVAAHAGERGFVMLLPTRLYQVGGAAVVAASFLVVASFRGDTLGRWLRSSRWLLPWGPPRLVGSNTAATVALVALVVAGFAGSRDPLANPLPLAVWTLGWVGLTLAHAALGPIWPALNPWSVPAALVRRIIGLGGGATGPMRYPVLLGQWPAVALLACFAWFELVHPAPRDPALLAWALVGYSVLTVAGMVAFGDALWEERAEIFSRFFRMVSWLSPLQPVDPGEGSGRRLALVLPGSRLLTVGALPAAGVAFVILALASVSFDGLSRTFWWLDLVGENPLEHPGRSGLVGRNSLGLLVAPVVLLAAYAASVGLGARWSGMRASSATRVFVVSIVPIALGYHFAHYLPSFLVDAQHAVKALSDPLGRGWNLLGARDLHVTASILTHHESIERLWYAQVLGIVGAHVAAVVIAHALTSPSARGRRESMLAQFPLTALMVGYTLFGLWLLSTPVAT
jgi:hypothetical protein